MADATPLAGAIVYEPVHSRRLGQSLGIDLLPQRSKPCELDCTYCSGARRAGQADRVTNVPRERLQRMAAAIAEALPGAIVRIV